MKQNKKEIRRTSIESILIKCFLMIISLFTTLISNLNLAVALFKKSSRALKLSLSVLFTLIILSAALAIPQTFNIQGKLTNSAGNVLSGTYNMTFRIYDAYTNGNIIWQSLNQTITTDSDGIYNVILTNINTTFGAQYYLGIEVQSDGEMSPRINLTATPYAFRANVYSKTKSFEQILSFRNKQMTDDVQKFESFAISDNLICVDCVDGSDLADTITLDANMNIKGYKT